MAPTNWQRNLRGSGFSRSSRLPRNRGAGTLLSPLQNGPARPLSTGTPPGTVNAALLDRDLPVHAIEGPAIVLAGPDVSLLVRKGEYSVGIGCRKGVGQDEVTDAVRTALAENGIAETMYSSMQPRSKKCRNPALLMRSVPSLAI